MRTIVAGNDDISIRKMEETEEDFQLFLKWMTDPETMKYWEGMTEQFNYDRVVEQYHEHVEEQVQQCIIEYKNEAIGFCQFCVLDAEYFEVPQDQYDAMRKLVFKSYLL